MTSVPAATSSSCPVVPCGACPASSARTRGRLAAGSPWTDDTPHHNRCWLISEINSQALVDACR